MNDFLDENQFAFKKQTSTIHLLIQITEKIKASTEKGCFGCGIFIDPKKAFDTVNHNLLLKKLEHCDIRESTLEQGIYIRLVPSLPK